MPATVLIVEDEKNTRDGLVMALEDKYDVYEAANADEAFTLMGTETFEVILTDLRMAGKTGMSVIAKAMTLPNRPICIMMTAYGNVETAVEAMRRGAFDFLTKPVNLEKLELLIQRALNSRMLEKDNVELHERLDEKYSFQNVIIGQSRVLQHAIDQIKQVAPAKTTVLLQGETGTGKELFAQMLHQNSPRARRSFLTVHCASLNPNLLESEIFGHEKGAFTGASERRIGRFEAADKGTLFLDEIGEIDAATQVKLLRFLENRTFERLGSSKTLTVDVRLVCATNRNLQQMVAEGKFREDLFYRLNVVMVELPPLRVRQDDIPLLIDHYIKTFCQENGVVPPSLTDEALEILQNYNWPGNIRELRNFCEHAVVMMHGQRLTEYDLDPKFTAVQKLSRLASISTDSDVEDSLSKEESEKRLIHEALVKSKGNRTHAAELLGISRRTLHRKLSLWPEIDSEI